MTEVRFRRCAIEKCAIPLSEGKGLDVAKRNQVREGEIQVLWVDPGLEVVLLQRQRTCVRSGAVMVRRDVLMPTLDVVRREMDGFEKVGLTPASPSF